MGSKLTVFLKIFFCSSLINVKKNTIPNAWDPRSDPAFNLKILILYILLQLCFIKLIKSRESCFGFCCFCLLFSLKQFHTCYIPETAIKTCFAKKYSLNF